MANGFIRATKDSNLRGGVPPLDYETVAASAIEARPGWLARFVEDVWAPRARRRLAPKTWERDSIVYEKHIRPVLGARPIATLDIEDLASGGTSAKHPASAIRL